MDWEGGSGESSSEDPGLYMSPAGSAARPGPAVKGFHPADGRPNANGGSNRASDGDAVVPGAGSGEKTMGEGSNTGKAKKKEEEEEEEEMQCHLPTYMHYKDGDGKAHEIWFPEEQFHRARESKGLEGPGRIPQWPATTLRNFRSSLDFLLSCCMPNGWPKAVWLATESENEENCSNITSLWKSRLQCHLISTS
ncbi:hypothetical protein CERZMDRAFT_100796 [Cercospora zeae-maydis SCOH1-5]|uniref:Uncharacterized protein n=1 Tax=Cercospora zeae-maydis SCOH1-5 TaxID=717836 RepID=A0A6A6F5E5_9PEZI|nr:hypothetical protein CERZMDRAFT_100796 [Cercospora zeae-maydis SCOH1-5]